MRMSRRGFLGTAAGAVVGAGMCGRAAADARPNVVVLFSDDQRFDTIAALGNREIETPNLDRLVARGTAFTQATIMGGLHGAICVPSRAMLHTGRNLFHLGGPGDVIPPQFTSLPETLRAAGYCTHAIGKWHSDKAAFNRIYNEGGPIFFGGMHDPFSAKPHEHDATGEYGAASVRDFQGTHASEVFANAAIDFLKQPQQKPFFLYVAFTAPHDPRVAPEEFMRRYDPAKLHLPPSFMPEHPFDNGELKVRDELLAPFPRTQEEILRQTAEYYGIISHLDAQVGRVLDALEAQGLAENTIVVFAGDNGLALGRHGLMGKQSLYEHSIRVPLIYAGPGIPKGERREARCYVHDLFPTLCEGLGVPTPESVESRSLWGCFADPAARPYETTFHAYRDLQRAVRGERFKLIEYNVGGDKRTQLFDLFDDPWEINDLANSTPGVVADMREKLTKWRVEVELA